MKHQRPTNWMGLSSPAVGHRINYGATRKFSSWCVIWIDRAKSLLPSVTAVGFLSRQALCRDVKPLAQLASRMISPTLAAYGSMKRRSARGIWCGGVLSRTFQISAGNSSLRLLSEFRSLHKTKYFKQAQ